MTDLTLKSGHLVLPDGRVRGGIAVTDGMISTAATGRAIDLDGFTVLAGMVDIHGDGFERHLAPRRGAMNNLGTGLIACDAELAANGITTAVLAQYWSWEGGVRGPDFAKRLLSALKQVPMQSDIRVQLRFETHLLDDYEAFAATVLAEGVDYVVFNDHLPHDELAKGKRPPDLTEQALKSGRSPEVHHALLQELHAQSDRVPAALRGLAAQLLAQGVMLGSHDDHHPQDRVSARDIGLKVSEFPETLAAAEEASRGGDVIVLGAPNVVRGGSHAGKVSAADLVGQGLCDALASDYHYPALMQAAFKLVDDGVCNLPRAWALVSSGPARMLGLEDRGRIAPGLRADLVVLDEKTRRIGATICGGRISYLSGEVADRFLG